jgi:hypothetical protein
LLFFQVSGYANKLTGTHDGPDLPDLRKEHDEGSGVACFQALADFLRSLLNCNDDGRIIVAKQKLSGQTEEGYLKFVMLSAEKVFSEVLTALVYLLLLAMIFILFWWLIRFLSLCRLCVMHMLLFWLVEPSSLSKKHSCACAQACRQEI